MLLGLSSILLRINSAIQMSIVNQQYARAQAMSLSLNSPNYPSLRFAPNFVANQINTMLIGVSDNVATGSYIPKASVQTIARRRGLGSQEEKREPNLRGDVRVRTTVSLCTQSWVLSDGKPLLTYRVNGQTAVATSVFNLNESSKFEFCKGSSTL